MSLNADYIIAVLGTDSSLESEGRDRPSTYCDGASDPVPILGLPGCQTMLLSALALTTKPVILIVLFADPTTPPLDIPLAAILAVASPGPQGGLGVSQVLFGDINPSGRLPFTLYKSEDDFPDFEEYHLWAGSGFTHRYSTKTPAFPFAYGLSYSTWKASGLRIEQSVINPCEEITFELTLANGGPFDGERVVPVFLRVIPRDAPNHPIPLKNLIAFKRVYVDNGNSTDLAFTIGATELSLVDARGVKMVYPGTFEIQVEGLKANFTIQGRENVDLRAKCNVLGAVGC